MSERDASSVAAAAAAHDGIHTVPVGGVPLPTKPGSRGHPRPPEGWALLAEAARSVQGRLLDVSGTLGLGARAASGAAARTVLEPSAAALRCLRAAPPADAEVRPGLPWEAEPGAFDVVLLAPPAERGGERVRAELAAARRALRPGGAAWLLTHKDRGGKRYEREAAAWFAPVEVRAKRKGWRLARLVRPEAAADGAEEPAWRSATARGLTAWSLPGVFAGGKLDAGTERLLAALEASGGAPWRGARVWDLGCGSGWLGLWAARRGARVLASDDDLAAVRSAARTLPAGDGSGAVHADLDAGLASELRFERVLCNPPFHVGAGVRLDLSRAFVAAARRRLARGGEAWWVANAALDYEGWLGEAFRAVETVSRDGAFKVLRARP